MLYRIRRGIRVRGFVPDSGNVPLLYKEFQSVQCPAGVMFIPLCVIVVHIAALRPVAAERDKRILCREQGACMRLRQKK